MSLGSQRKLKMITVRCQVCSKLRNHERYRRHLVTHVNNSEISTREMKEILFQTKYSRNDKSVKVFNIAEGQTCCLCGNIVQALSKHVTRVHKISADSNEYVKIIDNAEICKRVNHFKVADEANSNPLFDYSNLNSVLTPKVLADIISNDITNSVPVNNSVFEYSPTVEDISEEVTTDTFNISRLKSHISNNLIRAIKSFKEFLSTRWGGSKSPKCIQMEISNICRLVDGTGLENLFNPHAVNCLLSKEGKNGSTPITTHSRIKSYERFILYLKSINSNLLPKAQCLDQLFFMINGVGKSLLRARNNRQKIVMANNRQRYDHAIEALKIWREKRNQNTVIDLFQDFSSNPLIPLTEDKYRRLRNFLAVEILLANGQRSGIISGMVIEEIIEGNKHITRQGHHKLMVSDHKTGSHQSATLFLYKNIFQMAVIFVNLILPKLPNNKVPSNHVFQTFSGAPISSSFVTRIVRNGLLELGISYKGTVNDFRRAAATLTGKLNPNISEKMALFMGHSRRIHDKHYRVQLGHIGLIDAFNSLEKMQTFPFSEELSETVDVSSSLLTKSLEHTLDSSIFSHCTLNDNALGDSNIDTNQINQNSCDLSSDQNLHISKSIGSSSLLELHENNCKNLNSSPYLNRNKCSLSDSMNRINIPVSPVVSFSNLDDLTSLDDQTPHPSLDQSTDIIDSINLFNNELQHSVDPIQDLSDSLSLSAGSSEFALSYSTPSDGSVVEVDLFDSEVDLPTSFSSKLRNSGNPYNLKECEIVIHPIRMKSSYDLRRFSNHSNTMLSPKLRYKSIFSFAEDEDIFFTTFHSYIQKVKDRSRISKNEITGRANASKRFAPVLDRLLSVNHGDIYQQLYNRIRTLGSKLRSNNGMFGAVSRKQCPKIQFDPLANSPLVKTSAHHRSLFEFQDEESLFLNVFSSLIEKVKNKQSVSKRMILNRAYLSNEFSPLLDKLFKNRSLSRVEQIIINKVRSSGYNIRGK